MLIVRTTYSQKNVIGFHYVIMFIKIIYLLLLFHINLIVPVLAYIDTQMLFTSSGMNVDQKSMMKLQGTSVTITSESDVDLWTHIS